MLFRSHVLVVDEAGQLGNRQALLLLEISRSTGARLLLIGDTRQTGAIEQGKPFWLMQRLGLPKAELREPVRQETDKMTQAVRLARLQNYDGSLSSLDRVMTADDSEQLAVSLVADWPRLSTESREETKILGIETATRTHSNKTGRAERRDRGD